MSHHYSGPALGFPHGDARLDLTDLYAFGKPGDDRKSILIMNVHPSFSLEPRGPTRSDPFAHEAIYELKIDTDGDSVADIAYRVRFSPFEGGAQTATLRCVRGAAAAGVGDTGDVLIEAAPVSLGRTPRVTEVGEHRLFAGWRSDPFFFDVLGVLDGFKFTHEDFFANKDVCSIVLEIPNVSLAPGRVGIWARTLDGAGGRWVQADRGARPAQTPFLTGEAIAAYTSRGTGRRPPIRLRVRALARTRRRLRRYRCGAGGRNAAPGHPALRSHAAGLVSGEWPHAHRRRPGPLHHDPHEREGDNGRRWRPR